MVKGVIVSKTLTKLGYGPKGVIPEDEMEAYMKTFKNMFLKMKENDLEGPKEFIKYFQREIMEKRGYEKEQIQEILAKAKMDKLTNKSMEANVYMEKAWNTIKNHFGLQGFVLRG